MREKGFSVTYSQWRTAQNEIARLTSELEAFRVQNEKIAEMRIADCERAEAAEGKL